MVYLIDKDEDGNIKKTSVTPVRFVPLTSKAKQANDEF